MELNPKGSNKNKNKIIHEWIENEKKNDTMLLVTVLYHNVRIELRWRSRVML